MDSKIPLNDQPRQKPSKLVIFGILLASCCLLYYIITIFAAVWLSYQEFQTSSKIKSSPYATATVLAQWPVIFSDDFEKVSDIWDIGTYRNKDYRTSRTILGGVYNWEIEAGDGFIFRQSANIPALHDFMLSVDVRHSEGTPYDGYGLTFREISGNYYAFGIQDDGTYWVIMHSLEQWTTIIPATYSSAVQPGLFNHLVVTAQDDLFRLFINGQYVSEFRGDTLASGDVGFMIDPESTPPTPEQQPFQGTNYSVTNKVAKIIVDNFEVRAPAGSLASENVPPQLPQIQPKPGKLVFVSNNGSLRDIYTINTDGSAMHQLTRTVADEFSPRWSPDGKKIVYVSKRDGDFEIYIMDANGENPVRLTHDASADISPDWSPDGRQIIFASNRSGNYDIYLMSADGEDASIIQLTNTTYDDINPSISPDGSRILYQTNKRGFYKLYVMAIDGKGGQEIGYYFDDSSDSDAAWSPDGQRIVYVETERASGKILIDGIHESRGHYSETWVTADMIGNYQYPLWSPDGEQIAFVSDMDGHWDIYVVLPEGSGIFRVTHSEDAEESPDWTNQ